MFIQSINQAGHDAAEAFLSGHPVPDDLEVTLTRRSITVAGAAWGDEFVASLNKALSNVMGNTCAPLTQVI